MQRPTLFSTTGAARAIFVLLLGAALVWAAPAHAQEVAISGVTSGQVVKEPVVLGATGDDKTVSMMLQLIGPEGVTQMGTADGREISLETAPAGGPAAWDPRGLPEGEYRLIATAQRSSRGAGRLVSASVSFAVEHPAAPGPAPAAEAALWFTDGSPDRLTQGQGQDIGLAFVGGLPAEGDVMLLCWDLERRRMVPGFVSYLTQGPWVIPAEQVSRLPAGRMELQAHLRGGGRVLQSARHPLVIEPFAPVAAAQPNQEASVTLAEGDAPSKTLQSEPTPGSHHTVGGGASAQGSARAGTPPRLTSRAGGGGAAGGAVRGAEATTPATGAPTGSAVVSPVPRTPDTTARAEPATTGAPAETAVPNTPSVSTASGLPTARQTTPVTTPASTPTPARAAPTAAAPAPTPARVAPTAAAPAPTPARVAPTAVASAPTPARAAPTAATPAPRPAAVAPTAVTPAPTPAPVATTRPAPRTSNPPVASTPAAPVTRTTPAAPPAAEVPVTVVTADAPADLPVQTPAAAPRGAVFEVQAWSIDQGRLIHDFAHTLTGSSLVVTADRLRQLPAGRVELEFIPVVDGERFESTYRTISVEGALADTGDNGLPVASATPTTGTPTISIPTAAAPASPAAPTTPGTPAVATPSAPQTASVPRTPGVAPTAAPGPAAQAPRENAPPASPAVSEAPAAPETPAAPAPEAPALADVDLDGLDAVATGFTVIAPSADTRTIYVAADGDDANNGTTESTAVRSMTRARDLVRDGMPDHIRFKAGDTFDFGLGVFNKSGRSADEPIVIGVYGDGPRPKFNLSGENFLVILDNNRAVNNLVVQGLHAEAVTRNPHLPGFEPDAADRPREVHQQRGIFGYGDISNVLIEDCVLNWFKDGLVFQGKPNDNEPIHNLTLRRNIVINSYSVTQEGHSQGLFAEFVFGLTLEENFFDHNGWCEAVEGAHRTKFNHNVYVQYSALDVELTGNVLSRGSSHGAQVRPGGQVVNNLFLRNALATFVARSASVVAHNVVLEADDIGAEDPRGFGIEVFPGPDTRVINNVLSTRIGSAFWAEPIGLSVDKNNLTRYSGPTRVELTDNKIYRWPIEFGRVLPIRYGIPDAVVVEARNAIDIASGSDSDPAWIDPARNVASYMGSIGRTPSLETFYAAAAARPRGQWLPELSASAVNTYVRAGFEVAGGD